MPLQQYAGTTAPRFVMLMICSTNFIFIIKEHKKDLKPVTPSSILTKLEEQQLNPKQKKVNNTNHCEGQYIA